MAKVITRVLAGRLNKFSENHFLIQGQGGFWPVKGCADQVLVLRSVRCDVTRETDIFGISGCKQGI